MKGIQLGALWSSQNGLQCWDHVCHKRHPSSIFGALVFHAKNVSMLKMSSQLGAGGQMGPVDFHKKWATLRQSHARSIIKIVDLHFTFQSTRLFSNETTEIPALAPCKMEVTLMIYVDCKSKYVRMVTAFQSQSKTERSCLKVDQCSWVQLHKPHEIQQPMPNFQVHPTSSPAKGTAASWSAMAQRHITGSKALPD